MRNSILSGLIVALCISSSIGQNLVPNPYFADTVGDFCPDNTSSCEPDDWVKTAKGWSSFGGTPDYFNSCSYYMGVPKNNFGYQNAVNGNAYCGLIAWPYDREYIGAQLITPLTTGNKYTASLIVSRADSCSYAVNKLGISFSLDPYTYVCINRGYEINHATLYDASIISNSSDWTTISGSFIADSDYAYIVVGNFFNDSLTDTVFEETTKFNDLAYYYVGFVSVVPDTVTVINNVTDIVHVSIYPNPATGLFRISCTSPITSMQVFDMAGRLVTAYPDGFNKNTGTINLEGKAKGVYLLRTTTACGIVNSKLVLE